MFDRDDAYIMSEPAVEACVAQAFPTIRFKGELRPSQRDVVEIARRKLAAGQRRLHIVAPPGSGKTILGLYLWAECLRAPAVVLSPNSAIQAQWAARGDLFALDGVHGLAISTDPQRPGLLTSLTYQSVTLPVRSGDDLDARAVALWQERLVTKEQARDPDEARAWIEDLRLRNPDYHDERLGAYRKAIRDTIALGGKALDTLHASALATLDRLRERGIGLIILDECHHLMTHWGRVLADVHRYFDGPAILGLTATPPDRAGKLPEDLRRYDEFFGPIDFEVPVPAVVKDGFLSPYQDLVFLVRPTAEELAFVAGADQQLQKLVEDLCQEGTEPSACAESLPKWLTRVLAERRLPTGTVKDWESFEKRDPAFAQAARLFLAMRGLPLPAGTPPAQPVHSTAPGGKDMTVLVPVLDRYIRHRLRASAESADHALADRAIQRLRFLGVQITETGTQVCASAVGRVLMHSRGKVAALLPLLKAERRALGDKIRAVIVADFEKTSAVSPEVQHLLDEEAGGAVAAFRILLTDPETDALDPVLVTGSSVLVDDDLAPHFAEAAVAWLEGKNLDIRFTFAEERGFKVMTGQGSDWGPRIYVAMITDLFQRGLCKCLVGTRGLLGEGWDASRVNVLIDLTSVTTATSVNQLRGRSLRLDAEFPDKVADNWDVICLAPEFLKGLDDYRRFIDKHDTLFGLTDDGAIEKGIGHVHAAFTEIEPEGIESSMGVLNAEMLERPFRRTAFRQLWRIGEPYHPEPIHALEAHNGGQGGGFPPFPWGKTPWSDSSLTAAIGEAILGALRETGLLCQQGDLHVGERAGGYVRAFLKNADEADSERFAQALAEALGPLERPRYVIPRQVDVIGDTWLSRVLPRIVGRYFQRRRSSVVMIHAVPSVLAKHKDIVAVYQRHWNARVSPGEAVYAHHGEGEKLVEQAKKAGQAPQGQLHRKEVFL